MRQPRRVDTSRRRRVYASTSMRRQEIFPLYLRRPVYVISRCQIQELGVSYVDLLMIQWPGVNSEPFMQPQTNDSAITQPMDGLST